MMNSLPEISERHATGDIAELYQTIREDTGSRLVNYIWRHLATINGAAAWAWATARANDTSAIAAEISAQADERARGLADAHPAGTPLRLGEEARAMVAVYNANNAANLARVAMLLRVLERPDAAANSMTPSAAGATARPAPDKPLPPLPSLEALAPADRALVDQLARSGPASDAGLIPSLWRHFTVEPGLLDRLHAPLVRLLTSPGFAEDFGALRRAAREAAENRHFAVPRPVDFDRVAAIDGLKRFSRMIAQLTLAGRVIAIWADRD